MLIVNRTRAASIEALVVEVLRKYKTITAAEGGIAIKENKTKLEIVMSNKQCGTIKGCCIHYVVPIKNYTNYLY